MLRNLLFILLLVTSLFSAEIAIVKKVGGEVFAKREDTLVKLAVGSHLEEGDTLITKEKSDVGVIFHDGTLLSLGENSILAIDSYLFQPAQKKYNFQLDMKKGTASFESGKIGELSPQSVKFKVPEGTVGIRGTKFYVEVK